MALTKVADIPQQMLDIYARTILYDQMPNMYFRQFVDYRMEPGLQPGERMMFTKVDNLVEGGQLVDEDTPITKNKMTGSAKYINLVEFGNAASFSRRAAKASLISMMDAARKVLGRDYSIVMDKYLRDVYESTANKFYCYADYSSAASIASVGGKFTSTCVDTLVEIAKNMNMPKLSRGADKFFVYIGTPGAIRQIRNSGGWLDARRYVDPSDMLNGEAGRLNDVVFLDSTHMQFMAGVGSVTTAGVHRGIFMGDAAVGFGESIPLELIPDAAEDFGRKQPLPPS